MNKRGYTKDSDLQRPKCEKCILTYPSSAVKQNVAMVRVYIKEKGKWKAIGWICPICGDFKLTEKPPLKDFKWPGFIIRSE